MSVGRTALMLAPIAFLARGAAFFVPVAVASWFGVTTETDAFYYALGIPSFLIVLASNAMATVLVPTLAQLHAHAPERMARVAGAAALLAAGAAVTIGVFFTLLLPVVLPRLTHFDVATQARTVQFAWSLHPFLAGVGASAVARAACEVQGRFALAAVSPVLRAGSQLALTWALLDIGSAILPLGMSAGALAETLWLVWVASRAGGRFAFAFERSGELEAAAMAVLPVLLGEAMVALSVVVDKAFASLLDAGSVSLLEYADRARLIPQTLLETSLLVVAFNAWARARALGEDRTAAVSAALRWVWLLAPPVLAGMFLARTAMIRLLFERGAFDPANTSACADALGAFIPGLFASLLGALQIRAHIVEGRYRLILLLGVSAFVLNGSLNMALLPFGIVGLATATSVTAAVITFASAVRLGVTIPRDGAWIAIASVGIAATPIRPESVMDPQLWALAVPCVALLGIGAVRARTP